MSTTPSEPSTVRVGDVERQSAIAQLRAQWQAGRLDPTEHEARTTKAYAAVTRGDLDALFTDLPALTTDAPITSAPATGTMPAGTMSASAPQVPSKEVSNTVPSRSWVRAHRDQVMGVTPFVALACFFIFGHWLFFLLIPAMGALLYSGDGGNDHGDKARRRRDRDERRRLERGE